MPRRVTGTRIKGSRSYTVEELAEVAGVTQQTVRQWIKRSMTALTDCRPTLILGCDAKDFLSSRIADRRCTLAFGEAYCLACGTARALEPGLVDFAPMHGNRGRITALCPTCGNLCNRMIGASDAGRYAEVFGFGTGSLEHA